MDIMVGSSAALETPELRLKGGFNDGTDILGGGLVDIEAGNPF